MSLQTCTSKKSKAFTIYSIKKSFFKLCIIGIDPELGPLAISIKREKFTHELRSSCYGQTVIVPPPSVTESSSSKKHSSSSTAHSDYLYRFTMRTSDLITLRGSILEKHFAHKVNAKE